MLPRDKDLLRKVAQFYRHVVLENDVSVREALHRFSRSDCQRLVAIGDLIVDQKQRVETAFVLAYYGVGYGTHVASIINVYSLWHRRVLNRLSGIE